MLAVNCFVPELKPGLVWCSSVVLRTKLSRFRGEDFIEKV